MINEEKVILMTHASLYENGEGKKQMKIADYYRHDYISVRLLLGWFWGTVGFAAMLALWVFYKMEYLMENLHNMDLKGFATTIVGLYVAAMVIYLGFLYGVYLFRYQAAKKSVGAYSHTLQKISEIYAKEEKMKDAGSLTEEMDHDGTT